MPRGRPKTFSNGKALVDLWCEFCSCIVSDGYTVVPTQTEFCRWLSTHYASTDRRTIYNALNKYFPTVKKEIEQVQSDVIAQGAMLGHYNPTMAIFGLKNWCKWTDKQQIEADVDTDLHITFDSSLEDFTG